MLNLTLDIIMSCLDAKKQRASSISSTGNIVGSNSREGSETYDKKNMPKLSKFSAGLDEDYFVWKDATVNSMGISGFGIYLKDKAEVQKKYPSVGESFFNSSTLRYMVYRLSNLLPRQWSTTTNV